MQKLKEKLGVHVLKVFFLDELDPNRGRETLEIIPDCGIACELQFDASREDDYSVEPFKE